MYKCDKCFYVSYSKYCLNFHQKHHHQRDFAQSRRLKSTKLQSETTVCGNFYDKTGILKSTQNVLDFQTNKSLNRKKNVWFSTENNNKYHLPEKTDSLNQMSRLYQCDYCLYETHNKLLFEHHSIIKHLEEKSTEEIKRFICEFCNYQTRINTIFKFHLMKRHRKTQKKKPFDYKKLIPQNRLNRSIKIPKIQAETKNNNSELLFFCEFCDFKTNKAIVFNQHITQNRHFVWHECAHCVFKSRVKFLFQNHLNLMHGIFACTHCPYLGTSKTDLHRHIMGVHFLHDEKQQDLFKCCGCGHTATSKGDLQRHILATHFL